MHVKALLIYSAILIAPILDSQDVWSMKDKVEYEDRLRTKAKSSDTHIKFDVGSESSSASLFLSPTSPKDHLLSEQSGVSESKACFSRGGERVSSEITLRIERNEFGEKSLKLSRFGTDQTVHLVPAKTAVTPTHFSNGL